MKNPEHVLFVQKVKPDKIDDYIKAHKSAWPELLQAIKECGIKQEVIWISNCTIYLYMLSDNFDEAMEKLTRKQVFKKWSAYMSDFLDQMQDYSKGGQNMKTLEKIFDLEKQLKDCNIE